MFPTFYDMKNQFWAGLGSRAVLVKKKAWGRLWATFEGVFFFMFSRAKKRKFENIIASTLKSCIEKSFCPFLQAKIGKFECKYMKVENKHSHLLGPCEIYPGFQNDWFSKLCLTVFNWVEKKTFSNLIFVLYIRAENSTCKLMVTLFLWQI